MAAVEQAMAGFRTGIVARRERSRSCASAWPPPRPCSTEAEAALAPEAESGIATFLGAFAILLREGLEALLVVIAMIAFLRKAERTEALPYVHGGWVAALLAGVATWAVGDLRYRHQRREPRADRRLRLAARRSRSCCRSASGCTARRRPTNGGATSPKRCRARCRAARPGSCSASPSSSSIARCSRRSCSTPRCGPPDNGATILAGALTAVGPARASSPGRCCASAGRCRSPNSSATARSSSPILAVVLAGKGVGALQEAGT